jgi:hypothetical protein
VQAIKAPTLLEICGPLFMSSAVVSNVQYRLTQEGPLTRVQFAHRAIGQIAPELRDGANLGTGWANLISRIREKAERASGARPGSK